MPALLVGVLHQNIFFKRLWLWNQRSYKGETHLKMTTRARAIHLKYQKQHLLCKADKIGRLWNRLSKIRLSSSSSHGSHYSLGLRCWPESILDPRCICFDEAYLTSNQVAQPPWNYTKSADFLPVSQPYCYCHCHCCCEQGHHNGRWILDTLTSKDW